MRARPRIAGKFASLTKLAGVKKGQSGNPKGRPQQSKNMATLFTKVLDEQVVVRYNGKFKKIIMREAIPMQIVKKSASGGTQSYPDSIRTDAED